MSLSRWDAPSGAYTSNIPPGVRAFREVLAYHFGFTRTEVIRDKSRCAGQRSEHCECGACDFFTKVYTKGRPVFEWCVANADPLGIQSVIFWRRVAGFGDPRERNYTGPADHKDHVHVGLNRWARKNLTAQMVRARLIVSSTGGDVYVKNKDTGVIYHVVGSGLRKVTSIKKWNALKKLGATFVELPKSDPFWTTFKPDA